MAELARLIGQQEAFAPVQSRHEAPAVAPTAQWDHAGYTQNTDQYGYAAPHAEEHDGYPPAGYASSEHGYAGQHDGYDDGHGHAYAADPDAHTTQQYEAQTSHYTDHGHYDDRGHYAGQDSPQQAYDGAGYGQEHDSAGYGQHATYGHSGETGYGEPQEAHDHASGYPGQDGGYQADRYREDDDGAYDAPRPRRRGGMFIVAGVMSLAVVGTAGAYAYRSVFGGSTANRATPVIRADVMPSKIVPTAQADGGKAIQERLGDRPSGERLVPREEQPVDIRNAAVNSPRVVVPWGAQASAGPPTITSSLGAPSSAPPGAPGAASPEPRKIKTLAIRADQGQASPDVASARASAAPATKPGRNAPGASGAPLSLAPTGAPEAVASPRLASASNTVGSISSPATRAVSAPVAEGSGYMVQVAAQKSQEEAQSSFRAMQSKYAALSGRQPVIKRKDLGEKGVFYGAQVGPLSREDASQLCDTLKAAGGSCMIQRN